jgi:hypothetical protein
MAKLFAGIKLLPFLDSPLRAEKTHHRQYRDSAEMLNPTRTANRRQTLSHVNFQNPVENQSQNNTWIGYLASDLNLAVWLAC